MSTLTIARRFRGPADSANGGYFAGRIAAEIAQTVTVRLLRPPPLDTPLELRTLPDGTLAVTHGQESIGTARPAPLSLAAPPAPAYFEAVEASRHYAGFHHHRFPGCFVCGTERARGDGMRIFAGPLPERGVVAAPWAPDPSLDQGDDKVRPEFMSAALDCPGFYAVNSDDRMMLLGELTAHVNRRVHIGERCTVVGWPLRSDGRKHGAGTAVFGEDGALCASARALWIEPKGA
ncbi:MAG: PaaI family thioesterase [Steroidobacteraceae bacterium]